MITVNASRREPICLRHQGENGAMRVAFPLSAFETDWPGGTPLLLVQRPRASRDTEAYPVALSVDGHTAYWTVSASDVEYSGYGKVQLQWRVEDVLAKSCIYDTVCVPSLHAGAEPPDEPSKRWFDAIQAQIGNLDNLTTEEKKNLVAAINEAARSGGGGGGGAQADWSQNDVQATDFVKNRPGAYMTDPVATEIYNGILPEMASIQMDYVPTLGDVVTVKVGTESIDCTVCDYDGIIYFATVPIEDIAGGTATNYVFCVYRESQWAAQTGGTYTGQNAVFEGTIRQVVKIPEKFLELENVKDVYWITFEFDQKTQTYFSKKIDGTYAEYADIKDAIDNGKLVAAVASVFGESNNVGLVDGYGKDVAGMSVSFYIVSRETSFELARYAAFNWKSGHIWEKIESTIRPYNGVPLKSELSGSEGTKIGYARGDHVHPLNVALQYVGEQIDGNSKTVQLGNIGDGLPYTGHGLNIPVRESITLSSDEISFLPVTFEWTGYAKLEFSRKSIDYVATLTYSACDDTWTLETNQPLTNATLTYNAVPAQTKDYQKYVLAPYTVAPHLLLASPNGLHKLTVDDNGNVLVDGESGGTGKDGKDGITPTIGENGNWYLGTEDTGKPSRGATGPQGADGHTPVITASKSGKVTTIKADGEAIATVNDGADGTNGTDGAPGKDGADGAPGKDGVTPDIKIGTVTTLPAGSAATASMGGTAAQPTLNLGIPKGADGGNANVTKDAVVGALGFTPISADDVPVKSVNGQTGEAKTNWYFNVTGSVASPATTQTAAQIVAAQEAGFAPICSATFSDFRGLPATLPALVVSSMVCVFGGIGSTGGNTFYLTVMIDGAGNLTAKTDDVATKSDIPKIPTELKNPYSLNIKIGDTTTSYDGSAAKTVEIPEGVPAVTAADNGKILRVVNGAWAATELLNAGGVSF